MSIYKTSKSWKADVYFCGKRIASKGGFETRRQARKWHDYTKGLYLTKKMDPRQAQDFAFNELLERFKAIHLVSIRPGSANRYLIDINYRIYPYFAHLKLSKITVNQIEDFRASLCEEISAKSVNNCVGLLKIIFKKGVIWKMLPINPAAEVSFLKLDFQKYNWWDNEQDVRTFLEIAKDDRYHLAYRLALDLGLRLGEIIGLSKGDVCLERCQIHIHRQWLEKEKKYGPTKHNRERHVSYEQSSGLGSLLKAAIASSPHPEALLVTRTGKRLGARKLSGYHFRRLEKIAGVPSIRFHDLRHTFASWFMIRNDDIWALKGILGHSDVQTTQRYAHLSSRAQKVPNFDWGVMC